MLLQIFIVGLFGFLYSNLLHILFLLRLTFLNLVDLACSLALKNFNSFDEVVCIFEVLKWGYFVDKATMITQKFSSATVNFDFVCVGKVDFLSEVIRRVDN